MGILPGILKSVAQHAVTVLDSSSRRLSAASGQRCVRGQATRLPFVRHGFDCILSFESLYSIRPPWTVIAEFHRVLVPDGTLILLEPARHGFFSQLRDRISGPGKRIYSVDEIKYRLARADWEIQAVEESNGASEMPGRFYCVRALKKENAAEPVPQFLTAREMIERRKNKAPVGEELP